MGRDTSITGRKEAAPKLAALAVSGKKTATFEVLRPRRLEPLVEDSPLIPRAVEHVSGYIYYLGRLFIAAKRQIGFAVKSVDSKVRRQAKDELGGSCHANGLDANEAEAIDANSHA